MKTSNLSNIRGVALFGSPTAYIVLVHNIDVWAKHEDRSASSQRKQSLTHGRGGGTNRRAS